MYHSHDGINGGETSWTNFLAPWPLLEAAVENFKWFIRTAVYVECVLWLRHPSRTLQGWEKKWALGCVNPASWLPPAAGGEFTQPRAHSFAHLETFHFFKNLCWHLCNVKHGAVDELFRPSFPEAWFHRPHSSVTAVSDVNNQRPGGGGHSNSKFQELAPEDNKRQNNPSLQS